MKNIGKKTALSVWFAALLSLSSCGYKEKKAERKAAAEREKAEALERARADAERQERDLTDAIYDSLMNVPNTIDGMSAKQAHQVWDDFRLNDGMGTHHELDSLKSLSMANVLEQRVINSGKPIAEKHLKELYASLATYKLGIDVKSRIEKILSGKPYDGSKFGGLLLNFYGEEASDTVYGRYSYEFEEGQKNFVSAVLYGADTAQYGAGRKAEIVKIVENRYVQMMSELKKNRIAVAKQFADYYPVLDIDRIPKQYRKYVSKHDYAMSGCEGETEYSYPESWSLPQHFAIEKHVSVYDSKLKPEFFNVPGAKYKLVQVSNGKWQVVRTLKGKVEKTPVFTHNVDYTTELTSWGVDSVKQGDSYFSAEAGTNLGVHIYEREYEYVAHAVKSNKLPDPKGERAARISQLEQRKAYLDSLNHVCWEYSGRAQDRATELALKRLGRGR